MLGDYDSIQEWNVAKLHCSFNIFLNNSKQYIFSTNTCSRTVLFCDEKLHFINSFTSSCFTLYWWCERLKKAQKTQGRMRSTKRKQFSSSSKAMKAYLAKKRKTHNTHNWKMSSIVSVSFFQKKKKKSQSLFLEFSIIYRVLVLNLHYSKVFLIPTRNTSKTKQFILLFDLGLIQLKQP